MYNIDISLHPINLQAESCYHDTETGFYYLQSRYYDPAIGRFINADEFASTGQDFVGYNMFAYCGNNPVNRKDSEGTIWTAAISVGLGTIANVAAKALAAKITGEAFTVQDAIGAAVEGAIASTLTVLGGSAVLANTFGAIYGSMTTVILKEDYTEEGIKGIVANTASSFVSTAVLGSTGKLLQNYWGGKYVDADFMSNMVKKVFYKPKYVNENSIKTIVSDTIWDTVKNFPLEFV